MSRPHSTEMRSERRTNSRTASTNPSAPASTSDSDRSPSPKSSTDSSKPVFASDSVFSKFNPNVPLFTPSPFSSEPWEPLEPFPKISTPQQPNELTNRTAAGTSASSPGMTDAPGPEEVRGRQDGGFERHYGRRKSAGEIKIEEMCDAQLKEERRLRRAHRDSLKAWEERLRSISAGQGEE